MSATAICRPAIFDFLLGQDYFSPKILDDGRIACVMPLIYTAAIIVGTPATMEFYYDDRWCYHSLPEALIALHEWNGRDEPEGWHRHPMSGRRRPSGDPLAEYINH